jgi:hypothetical protein
VNVPTKLNGLKEREERKERESERILKVKRKNGTRKILKKAPTHHMTRPVSILRGVQIYLSGTR